jgi:flagellar protein FlaG
MEIASLHRPGQALEAVTQPVPAENVAANREIIQAVRALNAAELFGQNNELTFLLDRETHRPIIRLVDRKTKDVIRQIPPDYLLHLTEQMERQER